MRKIYQVCLLIICSTFLFAQNKELTNKIPGDTSFTIWGTNLKVTKQFPAASLVKFELDPRVVLHKDVVYKKEKGRTLHLDLFAPAEKRKKSSAAVLIIHGGGWRSGERSMEWPTAVKLAEHGYVAATVEYRLSPEAKYPTAIFDLKAAIKWLRANASQYNIDKNKIAVSGCSSGGELASFLGVTGDLLKFDEHKSNSKYSTSVQAVINIDGILDFTDPAESGKDSLPSKPSAGKAWFGSSFKEKPELWIEASPINYVNKRCPPILFINSSLSRFHAGRDVMIEKLNRLKIYSEVHTIENTPHPFWLFHPWFDETITCMLEFLDKTF
ncbi:MAG: alpha/beta hydrolase [Ignavibacteria bacterium]|nr:alpha/beta hydrolase [Ignavibacteria bacterium]